MNHDNAISIASRLSLVEKTSKAGNKYTEGTLYLVNDFPIRLDYLNEQALWAIKDALSQVRQQTSPIINTNDNPEASVER